VLGAAVQLVLAFGAAEAWGGAPLDAIRQAYPNASLVGCTTGGEILGTKVWDGTLSATAIAFEHTSVVTHSIRNVSFKDSYSAGVQLAKQFAPQGLNHLFLLADGSNLSWSDVVDGLVSRLPPGVTVSGGFAASGLVDKQTLVWCDTSPEGQMVAAIGFYGERLRIGIACSGVWGPLGPDRVVTSSNKNAIYKFDGRPALPIYKKYLGSSAADLPQAGKMFPLDVRLNPNQTRVLRTVMDVNEEDQSILCAGDVPEGSYARVMIGNVEDLIENAIQTGQASLSGMGGVKPQLSILVSCVGRRSVLKHRVDDEVDAVLDGLGEGSTVTGFYSHGEVAPAEPGGQPQLHNETMMITNFAEV
jgi:hypothetical protein